MRVFLASVVMASTAFAQAFGTWKLLEGRSTLHGSVLPKSLVLRIEPHPKGEIFTVDTVAVDGRSTSSSTILYLDGSPRELRDFECAGTQSSQRLDGQTVEILRNCGSGRWIRWIRRTPANPDELVLEVTEHGADGRQVERRLVLVKQSGE